MSPGRRGLLALALALLAGCANPPPAPPSAAEPAGGNALRVLVFRGGSAARLGHNHVLRAGDLRVDWPAAGPVLSFRLDALDIDPPALRAGLGPAFASAVDDEARAGTRANLLKALDAAAHPEVVARTLQQLGEGPRRAVEAEIALHGSVRRQWFVVEVEGRRARGEVVIRQSDFGIQPFTVLGGLLAVQDELVVQFEVRQP
ncbi:YceI family protein [Roseateles saccharophilus]|uniref:YceI-like domain-containing protein n=2 Tax=Roseateles saccharophilus TaxID=304 RepID=A0A4R3UJ23_ROSSA|nr:YceI-like domain-containing protein [Roseateles saccharophilus]